MSEASALDLPPPSGVLRTMLSTDIADATAADLWAWHTRPGAFLRLLPDWAPVQIGSAPPTIEAGATAQMRQRIGPAWVSWTSTITQVIPGEGFVDEANEGPFAHWRHAHRFEDAPAGARLVDEVQWRLPMGLLGKLAGSGHVGNELTRLLAWRHARTADDLARHHPYRERPRLRVGITGASGMVGSALSAFLTTGGHTVVPFVRRRPDPGEIGWDPAEGRLNPADLEGLDAIVHLAGAPIAQPWTPQAKAAIANSRSQGTSLLARAIAEAKTPVFVSASAVGWYGHREELVDEQSAPGTGFLAETALAWEAAADPARDAGVRVVHPRVGIVQSAKHGALAEMLPIFRAGGGGPLGGGRQGVPWVALDDLVAMLHTALFEPAYEGAFNAVAPHPVDQGTFARTLGHVLRRPACTPVPGFAVRAMFGEMGQHVLLEGARVRPKTLEDLGFRWTHPHLEGALRWALGRPPF